LLEDFFGQVFVYFPVTGDVGDVGAYCDLGVSSTFCGGHGVACLLGNGFEFLE
jgi:hypothetical protein